MYARIKQLHDCPLCCGYAGMWRHVFCVDWIQCILFFWSFLVVMSNPHRVLFLLMKHCCLSESQLSVYCCLCCTGYCGGCECSCWRFKKGSVSQTLFSPRRWLRCQCLCASEGLLILCLNFLKLLYLFGLNSEFTDVIFIRSVIIGLSRRHQEENQEKSNNSTARRCKQELKAWLFSRVLFTWNIQATMIVIGDLWRFKICCEFQWYVS